MVNAELLQGNWQKIRGQIQKRWGELAGDDLDQFQGNVDALIGEIQRKTGESRDAIQAGLDQLAARTNSMFDRTGEAARLYARQATDAMAAAARGAREGYAGTQQAVRSKPMESVAIAFGVGLLAGLAAVFMLRSR